MRRAFAPIVVGLVIVAGCGGDDDKGGEDSDKQQAEAAGLEFWQRVNAGDGKRVCQVSRPRFQTGNRCVDTIDNLANLRGKLGKPGERKVSVRGGDEAIVTTRYAGYGLAEVYLVKQDGKWKVAEFNGYEGR